MGDELQIGGGRNYEIKSGMALKRKMGWKSGSHYKIRSGMVMKRRIEAEVTIKSEVDEE